MVSQRYYLGENTTLNENCWLNDVLPYIKGIHAAIINCKVMHIAMVQIYNDFLQICRMWTA